MAQANDLVDLCVTFIEDRNAAYLCKENTVVYYTSLTGRKGDYAWVTLSLEETLRIIAATKLDPDHVGSFQKRFIIQAFQGVKYCDVVDIMGGCAVEPPRPLIGHEPCECPPHSPPR